MTWVFWLVVPAAVAFAAWSLASVWRLELRDGSPGSGGDDPRGGHHGVDHRGHDVDPAQVGRMTVDDVRTSTDKLPGQRHVSRPWSVGADRGAALVELALAMPLLVLLIIGGIDITMAVQTRGELQHYAQQIAASDLHEDEAGNLADAHGATLECFNQGTDSPCFPDGLDDTVERRQVVLASVFDGVVLPSFTVRGDGLGVIPPTS